MDKRALLSAITFGQRVAEEEGDALEGYFVETDLWKRLYSGEVDVVYGAKGSGKSALYSLLMRRRDPLFDRNVLLAAGENPRGAPAFRDLTVDPPVSEREFIGLWKLYLACLLLRVLEEYKIGSHTREELRTRLSREGLAESSWSLQSLVRGAREYVQQAFRPPKSLEAGLELDAATQLPKGFRGQITFHEPTVEGSQAGYRSVDHLLSLAGKALSDTGYRVWVLLDRLDVAFAESPELEQNALRALFHVYLDLASIDCITLKVFLRTDIWRRITASGFREASHITRHMTIAWNSGSLLNLVVRRAAQNDLLLGAYTVSRESVLGSTESQQAFFYTMCPRQVDVGANKPGTFEWMMSRTRDGLLENAPRELIHFLTSLRECQVRRLEIGDAVPDGHNLFARATFKEALQDVSRVRLEQTLYAEYPSIRERVEALRGAKTSQRADTLADVWRVDAELAAEWAGELVSMGFFERRGDTRDPEYWVPFLYRDALDMVQGAAE